MSGREIADRVLVSFATPFPPGFLEKYVQLECLAVGRGTETFLVRERAGEGLFVAKCYDRATAGGAAELSILRLPDDPDIPRFVDAFEDESRVCVVREYVEGTSLDRLLANGPLCEARAVQICASLCDALIRLHGRERPVIHRDIKPGNVVVRPDGSARLIDFEISREYRDGAGADTRALGTREYAPPEQYGFGQTDCRADIYALGVLLVCMLTGTTRVAEARLDNPRLRTVARRCTAFSPEERYPSAKAVRRALLRAERPRPRLIRLAAVALFVTAALCGGFYAGRFTGMFSGAGGIEFREPLVEKAVRIQLGKDSGDPITRAELWTVKAIYIFGSEVAATEEPFRDGLSGARRDEPRGKIETLADVSLLPNLETLYVNYQALSDLSPLAHCENLRVVSLRHTRVSDVSPLAGLSRLENASLFDTNVSDASALDACLHLRSLDVGGTLIQTPAAVGGPLDSLSLKQASLDSLDGIEIFESLSFLDLSGTELTDLSPLLALPALRTLALDESMRAAGDAIAPEAGFEITYQ